LIGMGCLLVGLHRPQRSLAGPVPSHTVKREPTDRVATSRSTSVGNVPNVAPQKLPVIAVRSTPTELRIPAIGLDTSLSTLGLNADGTVQVPTDIQQPGWYRYGSSPGQEGSAVILGHVDSYEGPAIFFKLRTLVAGDVVDVSLADGATAQFAVDSVSQYQKSDFPDQAIYAAHGASELQLVTCGGEFDTQTGHYLSNLVVHTSLIATTPATAPAAASPAPVT
jgi:sortase (surface protein transpeptidase)